MIALTLLAACTNLAERTFYPEGGARASAVPTLDDTGTTFDDSGTTSSDGVPQIVDQACYFVESEAGDVIVCDIYVNDGTPDDLLGGRVTYDVTEGNGSADTQYQDIVSVESADSPGEKAAYHEDDGYVQFQILGVDVTSTYLVDRISVQDNAGHTSDEVAQEVTP